MPHTVPIEIFMVAKTAVDRAAVQRWLDFLGVQDFDYPTPEAVSDPSFLVALAGKRCYKSFDTSLNPNISKVRKDYVEYFDNILASGHGSVLEHSVFTFAIENVSRVFTGEMNRHRAGWAISEGSMRFIRYPESIPYWEPDSIKGEDSMGLAADVFVSNGIQWYETGGIGGEAYRTDKEDLRSEASLEQKKEITRAIFRRSFRRTEVLYKIMEDLWADELKPESKFKGKKEITSMMRRIVGTGVATGGVWTGNVRALRHVIALRAAAAAEEEILHVFSRVAKMMRDAEPLLFGDFEQRDGYWVPKYPKV